MMSQPRFGRWAVTFGLALAAAWVPPQAAAASQADRLLLRLPNGMTGVLEASAPNTLLVESLLVVRAGGEKTSLLVSHAMLAQEQASGNSLRRELALRGIGVQVETAEDLMVFRFQMPARSTSEFLQLLAAMLQRNLDQAAYLSARLQVEQFAAAQALDPWLQGAKLLNQMAWSGPSGRRRPKSDSQSSFDPADLESHRKSVFTPERMALAVWGDLSPSSLRVGFKRFLGSLRPAERVPARPEEEKAAAEASGPQESRHACLSHPQLAVPVLLLGVPLPLEEEGSFWGCQVLSHLLGGGHSSRLHQRMRLQSSLAYSIEAECVPQGPSRLLLRIRAQTDKFRRVRGAVLEVLAGLARQEVSDTELRRSAAVIGSRLMLDAESQGTRFYNWARQALGQEATPDPREAARYLEGIDPSFIRKLASSLSLGGEPLTVVVSDNPGQACTSLKEDSDRPVHATAGPPQGGSK